MNGNRRGTTARICGWNPEHGHEYEHEYGREGSGVNMNVDNDFTTAFLRQILTPNEFRYLVSITMSTSVSMSMSTEGAHIQAGKGLISWSDCDPRHLRQIIRMIHHGYKYKYQKSDRSARARTRTRNSNDSNANAKRYQSINEIRMILLQIVLFLQECTNRNNGDGNGDDDACAATGAAVILTDEHEHKHEHTDTGTASSNSNYVAIELIMPLSYYPKEEKHEPSSSFSSSSHLSSRNPTTKPQAVIRVSHARARTNQAALAFFRDLNVDVDIDVGVDGPVDEPSPSSCSSNLNLLTLYTSHSSLLEFTGAGKRMGQVEGAADTDTDAVLRNFIQGCGLLDAPSGLEVHEGILMVPDYMRDFINVMGTPTPTGGMDFMNMNIRGDGDEDNQRGEVCDGDNNNGEGCPFHSLRLDRILKLGAGAGAYSSHQNQTLVQDQSGQARLPQNPIDRDHHQDDHFRNRNCDVDVDEDVDKDKGDSTYSSNDQDYATEDSDSDSDSDQFASDSEDGYWGYEQECKREREHEYEHDDNSLQSGIGSFITCLGTISSLPDTMLKSMLVHTDHQHKYRRQFQQRKRRRWSTIMAILYSNILRLAFWSLVFSILFLIVAEWKARQYDDPLLQQYILSRRRLDIDVNTDMNIFHSNSVFSKVVFITRYVYLHLHLLLHSYSYQYQYPGHFQFIPIAITDWNDTMGENQDQDQYQKMAAARLTFLLTGRQMFRDVWDSLFIFSIRGSGDVGMIMSNINRQMRSVFRFESLWNVFVEKAGVIGNAAGDVVALGMNVLKD